MSITGQEPVTGFKNVAHLVAWSAAGCWVVLLFSAGAQVRCFAAVQVAHSSTATEAEANCKISKEVWQALVWLGQRRSNLWPVLLPSLYACSGKLMWLDLPFNSDPHPRPT